MVVHPAVNVYRKLGAAAFQGKSPEAVKRLPEAVGPGEGADIYMEQLDNDTIKISCLNLCLSHAKLPLSPRKS